MRLTNLISRQEFPKYSFSVSWALDKFIPNLSQTELICTIWVNMQNHKVVQSCLGHGRPQIRFQASQRTKWTFTHFFPKLLFGNLKFLGWWAFVVIESVVIGLVNGELPVTKLWSGSLILFQYNYLLLLDTYFGSVFWAADSPKLKKHVFRLRTPCVLNASSYEFLAQHVIDNWV